jgi:hemerythrin-like domain-containing protein
MSSTHARRRDRPISPITLHEFEALDRTHGEVVQSLRELERLIDRLEAGDIDAQARAVSAALCAFFDGTSRAHHEDEERVVFPPLLAGDDAMLIQHVRRLQQDHGWLEEDWRELRPHLHAVAEGLHGLDTDLLREMAAVFSTLYVEHIALEESLIYPASRQCLQAVEIAERRRLAAAEG